MGETVHFQHFEVLRREDGSLFELGRGAMGITYKAFDTNLRCNVALKVINSAYLNSEIARQRFLREARAAAALRHANVATVFHLGNEDENYFYAMEFVDGETVEAYMKREGAVSTAMALEIAIQVSRALAAAEKQGLVHRDIKPSNLMLLREDEQEFLVKVIDFGLAKSANGPEGNEDAVTLTSGGFLGTPHFASPEQLEEREIDVRSDIYSLGVTLWYMLAGKTPFSGSLAQVMSQHLHRDPPFETLDGQPVQVVALLRRMMAKAPGDRPQSPAALRKEVEACLGSLPAPDSAPTVHSVDDDAFETAILPEPMSRQATALGSGQILAGRYRLLGEVMASDHGRVFHAESVEDGSPVAVLILRAEKLPTAQSFTQLEAEVESLQKLRSPSVQKILSLERTDWESFLVLEWVEGPALLDLLRSRRALPVPEAVRILQPLAGAFDELFQSGLSCPDIGVHEIVLTGGDVAQAVTVWSGFSPKFLPLTQAGSDSLPADATMVASSFAMMKASGAFAGHPAAAYVFAIASLAFEMLGGARSGSTTGYAPVAGLSEEVNSILHRALKPSTTYASAGAFVDALAAAKLLVPPPVSASAAPSSVSQISPILEDEGAAAKRKAALPLLLTSGAAIIVVVLLAVVFGRHTAETVASPVVAASPSPVPSPEDVPLVATPNQPYLDELAAAESLRRQDDYAGALNAYASLARKYPDEKEPLNAMEMIAASLRRRSSPMGQAEFTSLRPALENAAALKVISAQMILGEMLRTLEPEEAVKWFTAASEGNQSEAMVYLGQMMANGRGVPAVDFGAATGWFAKAADLGDPAGMYCLAECYLFGKGIEKNPKKAVELLTAASVLGDARSMNLLGTLYRQGIPDLFPPDFEEAYRLFSQAASMGFLDAQGNLGVLAINGQGGPKDEKKAVELFKSGAEQGNALCMYFYARCLEGGVGLAEDMALARKWYITAAQGGNKLAIEWCRQHNVPLINSP